ncbi:MAG: carbohydrate-binding protein [Tannerella sp.]|jgi:hypothetical protein|nr:carbohydrate-binding protein [Tannerella sp.]
MKTNILITLQRLSCLLLLGCSLTGCGDKYDKEIEKNFYVNKTALSLYYGDKVQMTASPASGTFGWTSEDPTVATVTASGLVEAVGVGTTNILISMDDILKEIPVTSIVPTVDKVTGMPGNKRAALKLTITNDRIKSVKVTRVDNNESQETEINYQSGTISLYYNNLNDGNYLFRVFAYDKFGNESAPVELNVKAYGDVYQSSLVNREINVVSKFGNGLSISWKNQAGSWVKFLYNNETASKVIAVSAQSTHLADYDAGTFSYSTLYLPETAAVDTFASAQTSYTGRVDDYITYVRTGETVVNPGDFDLGGDGVGFHDSNTNHDPGSGGANYRPSRGDTQSDAVDIEGDGGNIGYTGGGEWLAYTVHVLDEADYEIDWYISVNGGGAACHIEVDGVKSSAYQMVNNSNWSDWRYYCERNSVAPPVFHLTAGKHKVTYYFEGGDHNYNGLRLKSK